MEKNLNNAISFLPFAFMLHNIEEAISTEAWIRNIPVRFPYFVTTKQFDIAVFTFYRTEEEEEEMKHDFLWRVYPHFPAKGMIEVFNRSYYEDILVSSIEEKPSKEELINRCQLIISL